MNCLSCARTGTDRIAVALCPHCQAGLCLDHVQQAADAPGPGGFRLSCDHRTWSPEVEQRRRTDRKSKSADRPPPTLRQLRGQDAARP